MKKLFLLILVSIFFFSCNTDKKKNKNNGKIGPCDSLTVVVNEMEQEKDSLLSLVLYQERKIQELVNDTQNVGYKPLNVNVLFGQFTSVSRDECFHLIFTDSSGGEWDFGSANNILGFDLYTYDYNKDEFYINPECLEKDYRVYWAMLRNIVCDEGQGAGNINQSYKEMPTILKAEMVK
jgi:hypothetical protein